MYTPLRSTSISQKSLLADDSPSLYLASVSITCSLPFLYEITAAQRAAARREADRAAAWARATREAGIAQREVWRRKEVKISSELIRSLSQPILFILVHSLPDDLHFHTPRLQLPRKSIARKKLVSQKDVTARQLKR